MRNQPKESAVGIPVLQGREDVNGMTQRTSTPSTTTPAELKTLYPYQFAGKSIELSFMRGWFSLFANT